MKSIETRFTKATVIICLALLCGCETTKQKGDFDASSRPISEEAFLASLPDDVDPVSRGRIPLVNREDLDDERKPAYDARVSPDSKSLAGLYGPGGLGLNGSADLGETLVDKRTQELARLVVSREMDQAFEWTVHEPVALKAGLEPEIIDVIRHRRSLAGLPEREAAIIQWGRELFQEHRVSAETFARVKAQLSTRDMVDLCHFMGNYTRTAILLHTFDVHLPYDRPPLLPLR
ncbi:MAG: carboxymuconolactone decarboxylase family protein [Woeseiaceae bacterium]|nr:carboxymuconolactone decarboxylase family protein [Woeseiaceae bacterium]